MIHETAFAIEAVAAARVAPRLLPRIAKHRVPRFGIVGQKCAQLVANRPDVRVPFDADGVLRDTLARVDRDATGATVVRASVATVARSPCGRYAVKTANDARTPAFASAASFAARAFAPALDELVFAPLADEVRLETERAKNRALRASLRGARGVVVPRVLASDRTRVVMDFERATLARDVRAPVPMRDVCAFFVDVAGAAARTGVVHCDMHAANVGVRRGRGEGDATEFVVYDFGAVREGAPVVRLARPGPIARAAEAAAFGAIGGATSDAASAAWADVAVTEARAAGVLLAGSREQARALVVACAEYARGACDFEGVRPAFAAAGGDVRLAPDVSRFLGAMAVLEATCKRLNPEFTVYVAVAARYGGPFAGALWNFRGA